MFLEERVRLEKKQNKITRSHEKKQQARYRETGKKNCSFLGRETLLRPEKDELLIQPNKKIKTNIKFKQLKSAKEIIFSPKQLRLFLKSPLTFREN